ncbi:MAG: hypothetical protein HC883_00225 [Bdellovibrionaceae bacterium]|nr:hypothetical protein [Pseudobdellovibrionaceae bacterium]
MSFASELTSTDPSISAMVERWRMTVESGSVFKNQLWGIVNGVFYIPNAAKNSIFLGISFSGLHLEDPSIILPANSSIDLPANLDSVDWEAWLMIDKFQPGTESGFIADPYFPVWKAVPRLFRTYKGIPVYVFNESTETWDYYSPWLNEIRDLQKFSSPIPIKQYMSYAGLPFSREAAQEAIIETGFFKLKTDYLTIGDEPLDQAYGVLDLSSSLTSEDVDTLKKFFTMMPRSMLWEFFTQKIWPEIPWDIHNPAEPGDYFGMIKFAGDTKKIMVDPIYGSRYQKKMFQDMVWGAFIDLFNVANLDHCNKNQLEPWAWEQEKMDAYYVASNTEAMSQLNDQIGQYRDIALATDPKARAVMESYLKISKLGDLGLEINRQNAVKELLKKQDYATAQAIVDAYRYASETVIGEALTQPIPFDVTTDGGTVIAKQSEGV